MSQFAGSDSCVLRTDASLFSEQTFQDRGKGVLSIEEECLKWTSNDQSDSVTLNYPSICLHAISRDTCSFPHECLYLLCEEGQDSSGSEDGSSEGESSNNMTELRFVPSNIEDLERLYSSICQCQILYPDPELSDDSMEEEEEVNESEGEGPEWMGLVEQDEGVEQGVFYTSAEEGLPHLSGEGRAVLEHLESVIVMPSAEDFVELVNNEGQNGTDDRFEDVSEDSS